MGRAEVNVANLFECELRTRQSAMGTIGDLQNQSWTVPGKNNFASGPAAFNLFNECSGVVPANIQELNLNALDAVEIDPDGQIITGYIFADNYFELYINGQFIATDPVPYTPFNSSIVKPRLLPPRLWYVVMTWVKSPFG